MSLLKTERESAEWRDWGTHRPNRIIAFGILNASGIPVFCDVGINVFHEQVRGEDPMDEISPDMAIVKVILEQRWDLCFAKVASVQKEGLDDCGLTSTEQMSIEQSIKS